MQSFELLSSLAAALWHPQLRKTCSERANNHSVRAPEPIQVISCRRPAVKSWSGQAAQSCEILRGPAATLGHPQLRQACDASIRPHWAEAEGTQGAPRKMRRQGAATPGPTHRVSVGGSPSLLFRGSPTPPHSGVCRLTARHGGAHSAEGTKGAPRKMRRSSNPGAHSPGVFVQCPQTPHASAAAHRPLRRQY